MAAISNPKNRAISWERVRAIFGNADPPRDVWEKQFDYFDGDLRRMAASPYREFDRHDLWYYFHDLAYVELQPELFNYLFPVCLMEWHDTLMRGQACSHGDSEFHYGMQYGKVFDTMLTARQQNEVIAFFVDSFLQRLDTEPVIMEPSVDRNPFGWISRFNSLGLIIPRLESVWEPWWSMETRGRAIAVLKYCSGLACFEGENNLFGLEFAPHPGRFGPSLWENDSYCHAANWLEPNVRFLCDVLTFEYVLRKVKEAADRLANEPEKELATMLVAETIGNRELVEHRIAELPRLLSGEQSAGIEGWSI